MKIKYFVVSYRCKVGDDWATVEKIFHTRDEVMDFVCDNTRNNFGIRVCKDNAAD